jgi:hypothetical protein
MKIAYDNAHTNTNQRKFVKTKKVQQTVAHLKLSSVQGWGKSRLRPCILYAAVTTITVTILARVEENILVRLETLPSLKTLVHRV